jgi:hypothetical protein
MCNCSSVKPFLNAGHSNIGDLVTCQKGFLKHNISISKYQLIFILIIFVSDYDELHIFLRSGEDSFVFFPNGICIGLTVIRIARS